MKTIILTALLLISQSANSAELPEWYKSAIKSPTPNELEYYAFASPDCPVTTQEVSKHIEGVFIRSRIKPSVYGFKDNHLYLSVGIECLNIESNNPVFVVNVAFGKYNPRPSILFDKSYSTFGIGPREDIINTYKEATESAVTDYIKSNFNL